MEGTAQVRMGIEPIQAVEYELTTLTLYLGGVQLDQFTGKGEIPCPKVQYGRHIGMGKKIERIGRLSNSFFDLLARQG